jgi:5,10-methenyltetrahydrofolate synthetase
MTSKSDLRQSFRKTLSESLDSNERNEATRSLNRRLVQFLEKQSGLWTSFQPTGFEADIRPAMKSLTQIQWAFPRVEGEKMHFFEVASDATFSLNRWGIMEPDASHSTPVDMKALKGLLVPGLAFDRLCNRLGRGGGYYDRALAEIASINPNIIKIGVALDLQVSTEPIPAEVFDVQMDWVITESESIQLERIHS